MAKKNEPKNCSECKFCRFGNYCTKNKQPTNPGDWCAAGRKK